MGQLEFQDNNAIPGMAGMAERFLQVIKQRSDENQIGLDFQPKQDRKTRELFLEAVVRFKSRFVSGYPIRIRVHAVPRGNLLHVGYSVVTDEVNRFVANINSGNALDDAMKRDLNFRPENQRELTILMDSFAQAVYVPTVQDLMAAAEAARGRQSGQGFLGSN